MGCRKICYTVFILGLFSACQNGNSKADDNGYTARIENIRTEKDKELLTEGVIDDQDIENFKGLQYFPIDTNFRVKANIKKSDMQLVNFGTTKTEIQTYYRFCELSFKIGDSTAHLMAYAFDTSKVDMLFIPFRDKTTGKESYGGGRYIEMPYQGQQDVLTLDFNLAFNPYCHYNKDYTCPLVPYENTLNIAITAGEKKFHD